MYSIFKTDFYKCCHMLQYREDIVHFTSYLTPRKSRFKSIDKMVVFGIANFVHKFLVEDFQKNFFEQPATFIADEVKWILQRGLNYPDNLIEKTSKKILALHKLGYLPIQILGLPEGTLCPMQVPAISISSTNEAFAWVAQVIESLLSCEIWHPIMSATVGLEYKKIAKAAFDKTVDEDISHMTAMCDFSMRGQESYDSAVASGAAFLASFYNCSTVEAADYIDTNYNDDHFVRINGLTSTEHSVMCSDYAITGDERETYRRLLTEVYPNVSFAAVCDSYDFWNVVTNILPSLREEIEAHEGFLGVRHDSSEPIYALCGIEEIHLTDTVEFTYEDDFVEYVYSYFNEDYYCDYGYDGETIKMFYITYTNKKTGKIYEGVFKVEPEYLTERGALSDCDYTFLDRLCVEKIRNTRTWEDKGLVETLYELFGGTINSKGYKVINPKLKAVYGDSITIPRAKEIYSRLEAKGFAANNVSLGVGSFSMECLEENGELKPFTRDSFSIAIKATYGQRDVNGNYVEFPIVKHPKNCSDKNSLSGLCFPMKNNNGELYVVQNIPCENCSIYYATSEFVPYFSNGEEYQYSFEEVRNRMEENCR